jgi:hypothetical protein
MDALQSLLFPRFLAGIAIACLGLALSDLFPANAEAVMANLHKLDRPEISRVLFHPRTSGRDTPPQAKDLSFEVEPGIAIGCRLFTAEKNSPLVFFFHGNGEIVPDYDPVGPHYTAQGLNFLVADFRGYGWSAGTPSAGTLLEDAGKIYEKATAWLAENGYTGKIFVMGRSLGSGCAIDLAYRFEEMTSGLIIESGFAETLPLLRTLGVDPEALDIEEKDCFNNEEKISKVTMPTYILHGQRDSLIPLSHAYGLHAASGARVKELQIVPGADHNSIMTVAGVMYFQAIKGFIDKVTGEEGWRERRKRFRQQP